MSDMDFCIQPVHIISYKHFHVDRFLSRSVFYLICVWWMFVFLYKHTWRRLYVAFISSKMQTCKTFTSLVIIYLPCLHTSSFYQHITGYYLSHTPAMRTKPSVFSLSPTLLRSEVPKGVRSSVDTPGSLHLCCLMPVEKYKLWIQWLNIEG